MRSSITSKMPDPTPAKEATSGWEILASIAVGIGIIVLSTVLGASHIGRPRSSQI